MGDTKDNMMQIHIIHSVKGGSGKTAYSLFKSISLAHDMDKIMYFDADFKATAIKTLVYGRDYGAFNSINGERYVEDYEEHEKMIKSPMAGFIFSKNYQANTLNDYLCGDCNSLADILVHGGVFGFEEKDENTEIKMPEQLEAKVDFVFSSPEIDKKHWFQHEIGKRNQPPLNNGLFKRKMSALFEQILQFDYKAVVVDMPPSEDEYSKDLLAIIDELLRKKKVKVYYYAITTNDICHLDAEYEEFQFILRNRREVGVYEQYTMVYNEIRNAEFEDVEPYKKQLKDSLEKWHCSNCDKVYYVRCQFQPSYYDFCRTGRQQPFVCKLEEPKAIFL